MEYITEVPELQDVQHAKRAGPSLTARTPGSELLRIRETPQEGSIKGHRGDF